MSLGAQGTENAANADTDRIGREAAGQLARARTLLALAQRHAAALPLEPQDQEKSRAALAEAIGLCVTATRTAKAHNLYKLADSGLNPSELRQAVQRALSPRPDAEPHDPKRGARNPAPTPDRRSAPLLAQLDAARRMNVEGIRWLTHSEDSHDAEWRGNQLLKIAEQLCVTTALECKLLGLYVLGDPRDEPAAIRKAVRAWATEVTRKEVAEE
jgi:hypothetical protein